MRKRHTQLSGDVFVNENIKMDREAFSKIGGYMMQDDALFSFFTPKEAITFAARLKLSIPRKE
jgi:ABC-type multidrug transport system ATPase subunit